MLAFDTETTGLLRPGASELWQQPFIIEIYVCKFDDNFKIYDEYESFVKPPVPVPEITTNITGITDEHVQDAPNFASIYESLCDFFVGETDIYAHNCSFDINMLKNELARIDYVTKFPWPSNQICTVEKSMALQNKRLSLENLCGLAGILYEKGHRAKHDVQMMVGCIEWLNAQDLL